MSKIPSSLVVSLFVSCIFAGVAAAAIDDLWITEVVPSTGQVEVTNVGDDEFVTPSSLPFCYRINYAVRIPADTSFAAGESRVFVVPFQADDTDLWLYRGGSFGTASNIITGLKWGPMGNVGRTRIASDEGRWPGRDVFVPTPADGMALQLTGTDQFSDASWTEGVPDLGNYSPPPAPLDTEMSLVGGMLEFSWTGGEPPYLIQSSVDLTSWTDEMATVTNDMTFDTSVLGNRIFLRVGPAPVPDETAMFRITFTSTWSRDDFVTVPGGDHFSGLIGMTHDASTALWQAGELASEGIESMAETGSKSTLTGEIDALVAPGQGGGVKLSGGGLGAVGSQTTLEFEAALTHPLLSIVSMIAPSPDWFVGTESQPLLGVDGDWVDLLSIDLFAYDSGTDDGVNFTSGNADSVPQMPISPISETAPFELKPGVAGPVPLATIVIERIPPAVP